MSIYTVKCTDTCWTLFFITQSCFLSHLGIFVHFSKLPVFYKHCILLAEIRRAKRQNSLESVNEQ